MPRFNKRLEMRTFNGVQIPKSSKRAVSGSMSGVYFHWKGDWYFVTGDFYIPATDFSPAHYGDNEIVYFEK